MKIQDSQSFAPVPQTAVALYRVADPIDDQFYATFNSCVTSEDKASREMAHVTVTTSSATLNQR